MKIAGFYDESISNGLGWRAVLFVSGCPHHCKGCHNKEAQDFNFGTEFNKQEILDRINNNSILKGITISGGEPLCMQNQKEVLEFIKDVKKIKPNFNIWCYTGYTYEQLIKKSKNMPVIIDFLKEIDVLVDGRFIYKLKSLEAKFRGSKNQRLIDVPKTLNGNNIVLYNCKSYYKVNYVKDDSIYI